MLVVAVGSEPGYEMTLARQPGGEGVRRRTHKARIYATAVQMATLDGQGHTGRALWNLLQEWYTWGDGQIARRPSWAEMGRQLREARTDPLPGWEWLVTLPAQATQQVLKHFLRAWDNYYAGLAGRPRFKQRSRHMAVDNPQASDLHIVRLNRRWGEVTVQKVGRVRFRWTRPLPGVSPGCLGRITGARMVKDSLGWQIYFRIEELAIQEQPNRGLPVGVDRGITHTMAVSDGRHLDMPPLLSKGEQRRLRKLELQAARRRETRLCNAGTRISRREQRSYDQMAVIRARQARRREDWLHKQTTDLAKNHGLVVLEDLRIQSMTRSARGTTANPGKNVKAKAGLNRLILGMAWGKAGKLLAYKCRASGGELLKVNPRDSSLTCARCGYVAVGNRIGQATFRCLDCGHKANADTNAAQVLLARGRGLAAQSGTASGYGVAGRGAFAEGGLRSVNQPGRGKALDLLPGQSL
jgi:putative transposase